MAKSDPLKLTFDYCVVGEMPGLNGNDCTFIFSAELTVPLLASLFRSFEGELRSYLLYVFSQIPNEYNAWRRDDKSVVNSDVCSDWSCVAFRALTKGSPNLGEVYPQPLVKPLVRRGLIPAADPKGNPRKNLPKGSGGAPAFMQSLPRDVQLEILSEVALDRDIPLDDLWRIGSQGDTFGERDAQEGIKKAADGADALTLLLAEYLGHLRAYCGGRVKSKGATARKFCVPWFLMYLAREGFALWPRRAADVNSDTIVPRRFRNMLWELFAPARNRELCKRTFFNDGNSKHIERIRPVYRDILWRTDVFRQGRLEPAGPEIVFLKREYAVELKEGSGFGLNVIVRIILAHLNLKFEDLGASAAYFGGGGRITRDNAHSPFRWVDHPREHRMRKFKIIFGDVVPTTFPLYVRNWAELLRDLLPHYGVKDVSQVIKSIDYWLLYIISLGEDRAPRNWCDVDRQKHINAFGDPAFYTYRDFLRENAPVAAANRALTVLRQAWGIAATLHASDQTCPIDSRLDAFKNNDSASERTIRTHRRALSEEVLELVITENRRPDGNGNAFAFARSLLHRRLGEPIYARPSGDGSGKTVFWPALPTALDMILTSGMRSKSALWMDSGEGDEKWVDPVSLCEVENPLRTRSVGRNMGFLRILPIDNREFTVGMFLPVNKTGPYSVPWVDTETARLYLEMRQWQIQHNALNGPILAERDVANKEFAADLIPEVYPVFRDPASRQSLPPTRETLESYWIALLAHCEKIYNARKKDRSDKSGKRFVFEPFLLPAPEDVQPGQERRPRWDIHSLRVSAVTTLINAGVSPAIVAELVGHRSLMMTLHYLERNNAKTHAAIHKGMEKRRLRAIENLEHVTTDDSADRLLQDILGGQVSIREDSIGGELLREAVLSREPGAYEVFSHGICPGGNCDEGGQLYKNSFRPVFRPRACSMCRFRITGPAFLNGLVLRLNSLMIEIKNGFLKEAELNRQIEKLEDEGGVTAIIENLIKRERELRDAVWAEWAAELQTVRRCQSLLSEMSEGGSGGALITGLEQEQVISRFERVHDLELLHQVLQSCDVIAGAALDIPQGAREKRDEMLMEIARNNEVADLFYSLPASDREKSLNQFGAFICEHLRDIPDDYHTSHVDALISGEERLPSLREAVRSIVDREKLAKHSRFSGERLP